MTVEQASNALQDKAFLDQLYGYAYARCGSSADAEDLCSDIVLSILKSIRQGYEIRSFPAFAWCIARRVYADFCERRRRGRENIMPVGYDDSMLHGRPGMAEQLEDDAEEAEQLEQIFRRISFLSKINREVMVLYYLDEWKIADIARRLDISDNAVKQRLFAARKTIKKEVRKMETNNLTLRPIEFVCWGSGDPVKSDPFKHASRKFSQNVIYLCKDKARSAKDISTLLGVPMPFVEEELELQCSGSNGNDGLLKKLDNGKYISTFVMLDYEDYLEIQKFLAPHLDSFTDRIQAYVEKNKEKILALPFLNKQDDIRFILWSMIQDMTQGISKNLCRIILDKYYAGVQSDVKDYYPFAFVINPDGECRIRGVGCDSVHGSNICGYSNIFIQNIYDHFRIEAHFHCGLNLAATPYIQLTIRSIAKGLKIKNLTPGEQEAAATALEHGFVRKEGAALYPNILVLRNGDHRAFNAIAENFSSEVMDLANEIADGFHERVAQYLPEHLTGEAERLVGFAAGGFASDVIDKCIERGILYKPEKLLTAEGTLMVVQK